MSSSNNDVPTHSHESCVPVREVLNRVGDKWSLLVIMILSAEPVRFNALKRRIDGISQRMLTRTLQDLERCGLVTRTVEPSIPPKVEYALTALGKTLLEPVMGLIGWARQNYPNMLEAQERYDAIKK